MSEEQKKDVVVPEKFKALVEQVEQMSVLDLAELVKFLKINLVFQLPLQL